MRHLSAEIAVLLCIKLAALTLLYIAFFSPSHRIAIGVSQTSTHILDESPHP